MKKTDKKSIKHIDVTPNEVKSELANRFGITNASASNKNKEKKMLSLGDALNELDPFTEVIASDDLLSLQMCISIGNIYSREPDLYLYAYNSKGKIKSLKLTDNDLALLNKFKNYRPIKLGVAGTSNVDMSLPIKQIMDDVNKGLSKSDDKAIKKMLIAAKNRKAKAIKDPSEYSDIYTHNVDEARKAVGVKKPSWIKRLWYKIIGKSESLEIPNQLKKACKTNFKFPESETAVIIAERLSKSISDSCEKETEINDLRERLGIK